jgi:nucleotide-binding universal stress UspA family protein
MAQPAESPATQVRIARILVPTDFSLVAEAALTWAGAVSRSFGAGLILLRVIDVPDAGASTVGPEHLPSEEAGEQMRAEALDALSRAAARFPVSRTLLRDGSPRVEILNAATDVRADLSVMGTRGRTTMARALSGSVADHVVRHSTAPVLTVSRSGTTRTAGA